MRAITSICDDCYRLTCWCKGDAVENAVLGIVPRPARGQSPRAHNSNAVLKPSNSVASGHDGARFSGSDRTRNTSAGSRRVSPFEAGGVRCRQVFSEPMLPHLRRLMSANGDHI